MLYITDSTGAQKAGITVDHKEIGGESGSLVVLQARVYETDTMLHRRYVSATVQWNDGTVEVESFPPMSLDDIPAGYFTVMASRRLLPGSYVCVLTAQNYKSPVADTARLNYFVKVTASNPAYNPPKLVFGPILPRDSGFPNNSQWSFDIDSDLAILESSVKMLLLTSRGDRIMAPDYGTNIRRILFDMNIKSTEGLLREEIISAFSRWEPRVELAGMEVESDTNGRSVSVSLSLVSRLSRQPFQTSIQYNR